MLVKTFVLQGVEEKHHKDPRMGVYEETASDSRGQKGAGTCPST